MLPPLRLQAARPHPSEEGGLSLPRPAELVAPELSLRPLPSPNGSMAPLFSTRRVWGVMPAGWQTR